MDHVAVFHFSAWTSMFRANKFYFGAACLVVGIYLLPQVAFAASLMPWTGGKVPLLALKDMQGELRSLDQFKGKVVIVNFWATWCEPCIEEMPSLQRLKSRAASSRIEVIGVNLGEGEARIKAFTDKTGISFPILLDRDGVAKKSWKVNGVPATFVLDAKGRVRYKFVGVLDFGDPHVEEKIIRLIPKK